MLFTWMFQVWLSLSQTIQPVNLTMFTGGMGQETYLVVRSIQMSHASEKQGYMAVIYCHYLCILGIVYFKKMRHLDYIPQNNLLPGK